VGAEKAHHLAPPDLEVQVLDPARDLERPVAPVPLGETTRQDGGAAGIPGGLVKRWPDGPTNDRTLHGEPSTLPGPATASNVIRRDSLRPEGSRRCRTQSACRRCGEALLAAAEDDVEVRLLAPPGDLVAHLQRILVRDDARDRGAGAQRNAPASRV